MPGSLILMSASVPRPIVKPGATSGWRMPLTSRTRGPCSRRFQDSRLGRGGRRRNGVASTVNLPVGRVASSVY